MYAVAVVLLSPLLVFGVYHLSLWFNVMGIRTRVFWRQVALASAIAHLLLVIGFFVFTYVDYRLNANIAGAVGVFDVFLFSRSPFWSLVSVFDTVAMVVILGTFGTLDWLGIDFGTTVPVTAGIILLVGTLQWYWIGGAIGGAFERLWAGLKGPEDDPQDGPADWL